MRTSGGTRAALVGLALACSGLAATTSSGPTASPTSLTFSYQVNNATLPAAAKVTVTLPSTKSTLPMTVVAASAPQGWLTVSPDSGRSPLALSVEVNPTSMAPGSYFGTITIDAVPATGSPAVVGVTLSITNPPSTLVLASPSANFTPPSATSATPALAFTYTTGDTGPQPLSSELDVASSGDIIPFNVTTAGGTATKGKTTTAGWLRVNGSGQLPGTQTSGAALSGSQVPILVTVDPTTLASLAPGSYTSTITIAANNTVNGSATVSVTLVVSAGPPALRATIPIFPANVPAGPVVDPLITIYGDNFFASSVVSMDQGGVPVPLTTRLISRKILQATVKAAYFAASPSAVYPVVWNISVTNPAPATNPSQAPVSTTFTVTDPTQPSISSVVNAASYLATAVHTGTAANPVATGAISVSPREIISIFGANLGPTPATTASPTGTPPAYPTSLGNIQVAFQLGGGAGILLAPMLMASANQINCIVPIEVAVVAGTSSAQVTLQVINGTASTPAFPLTVVTADPGIFSFSGAGQGQAAVLNFDSASGSYIVNAAKSQAARGSTISIYASGLGDLLASAALPNGAVATDAIKLADSTTRVDIDGQPAVVTYAGTSPGAVAGLVQVNAVVPPTVKTGAAIPITVSIGSTTTARRSQPGLTLAVK